MLLDNLPVKFGLPREVYSSAVHPVIEAFAECVQLLPDRESSRHAGCSDLFRRAIERVSLALDYRRGQILPPNAAPEELGEQAHRWTYSVFIVALLYRTDASLLFDRCVPAFIRGWLLADASLARELPALMSGERLSGNSPIGALVLRADAVIDGQSSGPHSREQPPVAITTAECPDNVAKHDVPPKIIAAASRRSLEADAIEYAPTVARDFMHWLADGIGQGRMRINQLGASVQFVAEGMLLVSPRIFREYRRHLASNCVDGPASRHANEKDAVKAIQREVLRVGWHERIAGGVNMLTYQVMDQGRVVTRVSGVLIRRPERFVSPVPSPNPKLLRVLQDHDIG